MFRADNYDDSDDDEDEHTNLSIELWNNLEVSAFCKILK